MSLSRLRSRSWFRPVLFPVLAIVLSVPLIVAESETGSAFELGLDISVWVVGALLLSGIFRRPVAITIVLSVLPVLALTAVPPATAAIAQLAAVRNLRTTTAVAAVGVAAHAVYGIWRPMPGLSYAWWVTLVVIGYAAMIGWGRLARTRAALIESLRERARRAEAEQAGRVAQARAGERTALAREMHDVLAHRLSLAATYAGALEYREDAEPAQVARAAGVVREAVHQALEELREVIGVLRADTDPDDRPQPGLSEVATLVAEGRAAGADIRFDNLVAGAGSLPPASGRTSYRIVQEGLTNARKHAPGAPVCLEVAGNPGNGLRIVLRNPVTATGSDLPGSGTGLVGLTERARLTGGRLDHELTGSGEFRVEAWLPWPGER
ncbi:histidine kinase [Amycolatopsis ultiminotia]|uniref:histidine kinase n=1 Tax=Amycolatopsis ultiminotia TaxID=543629 RepID=A0ABP6W928_9PSEU